MVFAPEDPGPVELFAVSQDLLVLEQLDNLSVDVDDYGFSARDTGTSTRYVLHGYLETHTCYNLYLDQVQNGRSGRSTCYVRFKYVFSNSTC